MGKCIVVNPDMNWLSIEGKWQIDSSGRVLMASRITVLYNSNVIVITVPIVLKSIKFDSNTRRDTSISEVFANLPKYGGIGTPNNEGDTICLNAAVQPELKLCLERLSGINELLVVSTSY